MNGGLVRRVATRLVKPEWAARVVSPAYDSVRPNDRAELMARDPYVFLHVTRSPGDVTDGSSPTEVTEQNAAALQWLLDEGVFTEVRPPAFYAYRLQSGDHCQTAVVADVSLAGVEDGRISPHERVQPHRAEHLTVHVTKVSVNSSPVALGYQDDPVVDAVVDQVTACEPLLDFQREDGIHQTVWEVPEELAPRLEEHLGDKHLYIIDGHHRVAAGAEHWRLSGRPAAEAYVLGALFPTGQLRVSSFHRRVTDLGGHDVASLCDAIAANDFSVRPLGPDEDPSPPEPGTFGMYVDGIWYQLKAFRRHPAEFDVTLLQDRILGPILGVEESGPSGRLEYLPGSAGLDHLAHVTDRLGGVAFAVHPVLLSQLTAIVDRGQTLPPKSTYFEPKVRSGLFLTPR